MVGKKQYPGQVRLVFDEHSGEFQSEGKREDKVPGREDLKTTRQWVVLLLLGSGNLLVAACMSLQAPFFPQEAERKFVTPKEYGILFGTYYLSVFIFSHLCAKVINAVNPKEMFVTGLLMTGVCYILFGYLHQCPGGLTYKSLAFAIRFVEGVGSAACKTACSTIIMMEFPGSAASHFSNIEMYFGIGLLIGPIVGGILYENITYTTPFLAFGISVIVCTIFAGVLLPGRDEDDEQEVKDRKTLKHQGTKSFWMNPTVFIQYFAVMIGTMCVGYNQAVLEPHLRQFSLSPVALGLVFVVSGGLYALASPVWGTVCEMQTTPKITSAVGSMLIILSFLLIGPVSFINLNTQLWMIVFSLAIFGIGLGASLVSAFIDVLRETLRRGFPNDVSTFALTSSLFSSAVALGYFAGPSIGGYLLETIGYRKGTLIFVYAECALLCLFSLYILCERNGDCDWPDHPDLEESALLMSDPSFSVEAFDSDTLEFPYKPAGFHGFSIKTSYAVAKNRVKRVMEFNKRPPRHYGGTL